MAESSRGLWLALPLALILVLPVLWLMMQFPSPTGSGDATHGTGPASHPDAVSGTGGAASGDPHHALGSADCRHCHRAAPHREGRLNLHTASIACQTCHLPDALSQHTQASLATADSGAQGASVSDSSAEALPAARLAYFWFNVTDTRGADDDAAPGGHISDPGSRIWPFILLSDARPGRSPAAGGLTYRPVMQGPLDKTQALSCMDCHDEVSRLNWAALGYSGNPMRHGGRKLEGKRDSQASPGGG